MPITAHMQPKNLRATSQPITPTAVLKGDRGHLYNRGGAGLEPSTGRLVSNSAAQPVVTSGTSPCSHEYGSISPKIRRIHISSDESLQQGRNASRTPILPPNQPFLAIKGTASFPGFATRTLSKLHTTYGGLSAWTSQGSSAASTRPDCPSWLEMCRLTHAAGYPHVLDDLVQSTS